MLTICRGCDEEVEVADDSLNTKVECLSCRNAMLGKEHLMSTPPRPVYLGEIPETCQLCPSAIIDTFIDGRTKTGPWANMCPRCHRAHGVGLGTGKGQQYSKRGTGSTEEWVKTAG